MLLKKSVIQSMLNKHFDKPEDAPLRTFIANVLARSKHEYWDAMRFMDLGSGYHPREMDPSIFYVCVPLEIQPPKFGDTLRALWKNQYNQYLQVCPSYIFLSKDEIKKILQKQKLIPQKKALLSGIDKYWREGDLRDRINYQDFSSFLLIQLYDRDLYENIEITQTTWKKICDDIKPFRESVQKNWKKIRADKEKCFAENHDMQLDKETISSMIALELAHYPEVQKALNSALEEVFLDRLTKPEFELFLDSPHLPPYDYVRRDKIILPAQNIMMKAWEALENTHKNFEEKKTCAENEHSTSIALQPAELPHATDAFDNPLTKHDLMGMIHDAFGDEQNHDIKYPCNEQLYTWLYSNSKDTKHTDAIRTYIRKTLIDSLTSSFFHTQNQFNTWLDKVNSKLTIDIHTQYNISGIGTYITTAMIEHLLKLQVLRTPLPVTFHPLSPKRVAAANTPPDNENTASPVVAFRPISELLAKPTTAEALFSELLLPFKH